MGISLGISGWQALEVVAVDVDVGGKKFNDEAETDFLFSTFNAALKFVSDFPAPKELRNSY